MPTVTELVSAGAETQTLTFGSMTMLSTQETSAKYAFMLARCKGESFLPGILALTLGTGMSPLHVRVSVFSCSSSRAEVTALTEIMLGHHRSLSFSSENHHFKKLASGFSFWFPRTGRKINMLHNLST